jgi:glucosamine-6-phosphate deaminase
LNGIHRRNCGVEISISEQKQESGRLAAARGAVYIREAIQARGEATIIVATGASQFEMLEALVKEPDIDWNRVTGFHLDEYVGIPITHPASFRLYLWERFVSQLPLPMKSFHFLSAEGDPKSECQRAGTLIADRQVDVAFIGIGENAHVAFNDPPADFETADPYIVVDLDDACRRQQQGEGWFPTFDDVPTQAISMSVRQIMKSAAIICTVPDERKAGAVAKAAQGAITADVPSSILQEHPDCHLYLDQPAASKLA